MRPAIRDAQPTDSEKMLALLPNLADFDTPNNRNPDHLWQGDRATLLRWLDGDAPHTFVRVASSPNENVAGLAIVTLGDEMLSHEPSAHLEVLAVDPTQRRQGIAQALIDDAEQESRQRGAKSMSLHVFTNNTRARKLYEKCGFESEIIRCYKEI